MLVEHLPLSSAFVEARLDDPEVAEMLARQADTGRPSRPSLQDFTPEVAALYDVVDRLGENIAAVIIAAGGKAPTIAPVLRPMTGVERARMQMEIKHHTDLVDEVNAAMARWEKNQTDN